MKKLLPLLLCTITGCTQFERPADFGKYAPIIWSGQIGITAGYYLDESDYLIVQPGTVISFSGQSQILFLDGSCQFRGTKALPILFKQPSGTTNIITVNGNNSSNVIHYCDFGANRVVVQKKCLIYNSKVPLLDLDGTHSSAVRNSLLGFVRCRYGNASQAVDSVFNRASFSSYLFNGSPAENIEISDVSSLTVNDCDLMGNSSLSDPLTNRVVIETTSADLDLRNNYWRTNNGTWVVTQMIFSGSGGINNVVPVSGSYLSSAGPGW